MRLSFHQVGALALFLISFNTSVYCGSAIFSHDFELDSQFKQAGYPRNILAVTALAQARKSEQLVKCLNSVAKYVLPSNPADILLFHDGDYGLSENQQKITEHVNIDVIFPRIPSLYWRVPNFLNETDFSSWHSANAHGIGYRHMCRWYSHGLFTYLNKAGYQWVLRVDDDSMFHSPISFNFVESMTQNEQPYGFRVWFNDDIEVVWGLPELTSYFIVEEKMKPAWLYKLCSPRDLTGLNSIGGFEPQIVYNNFFITNVSFWLQPKVQRYIRLLELSGGFYKFRWGDAPVHTFVLGLFVNKTKLARFDFEYEHQGWRWKPCTGFVICDRYLAGNGTETK